MPGSVYQFGDFRLDCGRFELTRMGHSLSLERKPLELLILLAERRGQLVTRTEIAERLWEPEVFVDTEHGINTAIRKIRQTLRDDPDEPSFVQTVMGKGYRFVAEVAVQGSADSESSRANTDGGLSGSQTAVVESAPISPAGVLPQVSGNRWRWLAWAVPSLLLALAVAYVILKSRQTNATPAKIQSLAVLPLKNLSGDPGQDYFADGMTEALIGRLSMIHGLRVVSRTSVMRFKDAPTSVPEIAKTLGVDAIVEGSVMREGSHVRVHTQLIRAATDEHFWSESYDREMGSVLALESDIAQSIAEKVEVTVTGEERQRLAAAHPVAPEVYESYLKGRFVTNHQGRVELEQSIGYFEDAIHRDPNFAPAYLGVAEAYDDLGTYLVGGAPPEETRPKAISFARKALALDPNLAEAHSILADLLQTEWQWSEAETEYKRALELDPNNASVYVNRAWWLSCQGRTDEAVTKIRQARALDPVAVSGDEVSRTLFWARRYDEAIRESRSALATQPNDSYGLLNLGMALVANDQAADAIPVLEKAVSLSKGSPFATGVLIRAYAHAGRRGDALRLLSELKQRRKAGYIPTAAFVDAYLGLGDNEQAFYWLEQAYIERSNMLQTLKIYPYFDPIRSDPRFVDLVHRVGLG